jgi:CheY-like chemotaxis protein
MKMETKMFEELGLETAWLEHEPDTISKAKSYLEERNFIIHVSTKVEETEDWILQNGYDLLLTDLHFGEGETDGPDLIRTLRESEKRIITVPVSAYLKDYRRTLKKISSDLPSRSIDKATLETLDGLESMRRLLLAQTNGGRIRILERCPGFVDKENEDEVFVCVEMPNKRTEKRIFSKKMLYKTTIGTPGKFLEITTVERQRANGVVLQTVCKWLHEPI